MIVPKSYSALLQNRVILLAVFGLSIYEIFASWRAAATPVKTQLDAIHVFGLVVCVVFAAFIVLRSSFVGDRLVFGALFIAFCSWLLIGIVKPGNAFAQVLRSLVWVCWLFVAVVGLWIITLRGRSSLG